MYDPFIENSGISMIIHRFMLVKTFKYAIHSSKRLFLASGLSRAQSRDLNLHILGMIGIPIVKM